MTRRRTWLSVLAVGCLAWALGAEWVSIQREVPENHLLDLLAGLSFLAAGLVALDRRPGNRIGPLLLAAGLAWFCGNYGNLNLAGLSSLAVIASGMGDAFLAH